MSQRTETATSGKSRVWRMRAGLLALFLASYAWADGVQIEKSTDGGYTITGRTYRAEVDRSGAWRSLVIDGVEMFADQPVAGAPFPGGNPPKSINQQGRLLAIRNDRVRVEYAFDETGIDVETEGGQLNPRLGKAVTVFVCASGAAFNARSKYGIGDVRKVVAGKAAFSISQPYHSIGMCMKPSVLCGRGGKPETLFKARFECGISPEPTELVSIKGVDPTGKDPNGIPYFTQQETPAYDVTLKNLGTATVDVALRYTLYSHYVDGKVLAGGSLPAVKLKEQAGATVPLSVKVDEPGCYWINLEVQKNGQTLKRTCRAFVYDADNYTHKLTRPDDFTAFWDAKLKQLRAIPMDVKVTELPSKSTEVYIQSEVELTLWKGQRKSFIIQAPRKPGRYLALFNGKLSNPRTGANRVIVSISHSFWPESATYKTWKDADDNNLLECYLDAVRVADYLRSRPDVDMIYLSGASRQGPIQLVNAALDPTRICGVSSHVPTSMGVSWRDYPYRGWGTVPKDNTMATYVDPVNFAPDISVPFICNLGAYDGLSPVPGGLAFYNLATKSPFKRFRVESGGHGYFTSGFLQKADREMSELIKARVDTTVDEKTMKEH